MITEVDNAERLADAVEALTVAVERLIDEMRHRDCDRLLSAQETADLIGIGRATLYRLVGTGKFPQPIKLSDGLSVWKRSTVVSHIEGLE